ncbi:transducin family protein [Actinidia rufa]|uniref:Transducin family protein n=1 Tax=Actinidia rufa TaxID=165716 RepID=A0A7J0HFM3_9ERIC|nr:transducin family protein [Actinidia rufa]
MISYIYTAGADGIVCKLDSITGNLLGKYRASAKAISSMSVSSDGKILATAAARLKVFNCSDHTKIQKFSGHPGSVRCMVFTDDGNYILSSAISERYIALWKLDGGKNQSACCFLAMDHLAVFLDSRCVDAGDVDVSGLYVMAISEMGICYFCVFSVVWPYVSQVGSRIQMFVEVIVSVLDCANAEDAILPIPKVLDFHHQKKKHQNSAIVPDEVMADDVANDKRGAQAKEEKGEIISGG